MGSEEGSSRSGPDPRSLEERLRRLPPPAVPPGLRERILSRAPRFGPASGRVRPVRRSWSIGGLTAAAAVVLGAFLLEFHPAGRRSADPKRAGVPPASLYAGTVDPKETDPCCVLPPMPDWRS